MRDNKKLIVSCALACLTVSLLAGCSLFSSKKEKQEEPYINTGAQIVTTEATTEAMTEATTEAATQETTEAVPEATTEIVQETLEDEVISWNPDWKYADFSEIHSSDVTLYRSVAENRKNFIVAVNAGHGTSGGESKSTYSHPDMSPKVTGGTNSKGAVKSMAIASGMDFNDGTPEARATLNLAIVVKDKLLAAGYDVLMIREEEDTQLDNIARTVFANNNADCHIALHYDGTESDKGVFYMSVPEDDGYRSMEPVASRWQDHEALGQALIEGMREAGVSIFGDGTMSMDLTQTSFSTVPSVDLEVGDAASSRSEEVLAGLADGIVLGLNTLNP